MTPELQIQILKRVKSFLWRLGAYAVVSGCALLVDVVGLMNFDPVLVTIVSLVAGEVTKYVNTFAAK